MKAKRICSFILAFLFIGLTFNFSAFADNTSQRKIKVIWSYINSTGYQPVSGPCGCYAIAYCRDILDKKSHSWTEYSNEGYLPSKGRYGYTAAWGKGNYTSYTSSSASTVYKAVYDSINAGRPAILRVTGGRSSGTHYIAIVGYTGVTNTSSLGASNFLIIDSALKENKTAVENMGSVGYSLKNNKGYQYITTSSGRAEFEDDPDPDWDNPDNYPFPTRNLYYNGSAMTGRDVGWVQAVLRKLGYSLDLDMSFGPATKKVVIQFQKDNGLEQDGSVGPLTRAKLKERWDSISGGSTVVPSADFQPTLDQTLHLNGHTYQFYKGQTSWTNAKEYAESLGGHLMSVTSESEQNLILHYYNNISSDRMWLGATDAESEGDWRWVTGEPFGYVNWGSGEPNNSTGNGNPENYLCTSTDNYWNDCVNDWDGVNGFIVEFEPIEQDMISFNGHVYVLYAINTSWHSAKSFAEAKGGHLVTISNANEESVLADFVSELSGSIWIGLSDEANENQWQWVTGESFSYDNWNEGEPNDANDGEDYIEFYSNGKWNDVPAVYGNIYGFVVEYEPSLNKSFSYNGHLYEIYTMSKNSWVTADKFANIKGGHLVTITSAGEQSVIASNIEGFSGSLWIGATDVTNEGAWQWITGESFDYTNWEDGEPNNQNDSGENYAEIYLHGKWNDISDVSEGICGFIIEYDCLSGDASRHTWNSGVFEDSSNSVKVYTCTTCGAQKHEYAVRYDAQGGTGAPAQQMKQEGVDLTLSTDRPTKAGYAFIGWTADKDAVMIEYGSGSKYSKNEPVTLYALYKSDNAVVFWGDVNNDGETSPTDAKYILRYISGSSIPTQEQRVLADVDLSGDLTEDDAKLVNADYVGKVSEYPAEKLAQFSFTAPTKLTYNVGEEIDRTGMHIVVTNKNNSSVSYVIDEAIVLSGYDMSQPGNQTVTANWRAKTFTFPITVQCTHTWDDGVVTTAATTAEEGVKTFTCTVCGATRTESIPKALAKIAVTAANVSTGIKLTWAQDENATGYYVYRKTASTSYKAIRKITSNATLTYTDTSAEPGTKYTYCVKSYRGTEKGTFTAKSITCLAAITPTLANSKTGMTLTWTKAEGADGYYVIRKTGSGSYTTLKKIADPDTLTYTDTSAVSGTKYTYGVRAYKSTTKGAYTAKSMTFLSAVTPTLTNTASGVYIKWSAVSGAAGYYISRKEGTGSYARIATVYGSSTVSYTDSSVKDNNGTKYTYIVKAYKSTTNSAYTAKATYRLTGAALSSVTNSAAGTLKATWAKNAKATGYQVQYATNSKFTGASTITVSGAATLTKTIASLTKGSTYYVRVRVYKTVSSVKYYSAWSAVKSVKIAK